MPKKSCMASFLEFNAFAQRTWLRLLARKCERFLTMNIESFENLRAWIDSHRNLVQVGNPAVKQLITAAEEFLRVKFPDAYVLFLKTWGTLALGPLEFYGITGPNFDRGTVPNGIWY